MIYCSTKGCLSKALESGYCMHHHPKAPRVDIDKLRHGDSHQRDFDISLTPPAPMKPYEEDLKRIQEAVMETTQLREEPMGVSSKPKGELSGGDVNYYLLNITDPKRLKPYECEAEDIIEALNMTFAEGNVFKALWRSCAMRVRGHGKRGADENGTYDGDKIAYYGDRIKVQRRRKTQQAKQAST